MSFSRVQIQSSRANDRATYNAAIERRPMGLPRVFFTALVLLFGMLMYYVAMHYVPALSNPRKVLRLATETATIPTGPNTFEFKEPSALETLMGPYYNLFILDRAYMKAGESIQIKYEIPKGATVQLDIVQCNRIWVVEIFNCDIVNQFSSTKTNHRGIATYALGDSGFYHFRHRVDGLGETGKYRLIWERL
jgi:hypothetical protein